jgi:5-methylcytosine-specific restriction protein A
MKLTRLQPRLKATSSSRLTTLQTRPDVVERKRGRAGVADRTSIKRRDEGLCQECVRIGRPGPGWLVDHIVPLWEGGTDEAENKQTLCEEHHDAKTKREAARRHRGY